MLTLGDTQYHVGALADFEAVVRPDLGPRQADHPPGRSATTSTGPRTRAATSTTSTAPGRQSGPAGDRDKGYYSFDIGSWHLIALNSNCDQLDRGAAAERMRAGSPQERWLRSDLAAHRTSCTLAYWHSPRFNSGLPRQLSPRRSRSGTCSTRPAPTSC